VSGTNFAPYVKLLGLGGLAIPHVVLTDLDPVNGRSPLALRRVQKLLEIVEPSPAYDELADAAIFRRGERHGIFVNTNTLKLELFTTKLRTKMVRVLKAELSPGTRTRATFEGWEADPATVDVDSLIKLIERVGKGRFAQRIASAARERHCPAYLRAALERIRDAVA